MTDVFRQPIDAVTRYCAVLGHPIKHSASPAMQNAGIAALGLNWRYLAADVHPSQLRDAIAGAKALKYIGLNLTVPHKVLAMDMVDALDESARTWGAVNTVRFETKDDSGRWVPLGRVPADAAGEIRAHGFNTDSEGIARALREDLGLKLEGMRVLLVGTGGAGQVAALRLAAENVAELFLVDCAQAKAEAVAGEIRKRHPGVKTSMGFPAGEVDVMIQATPLGLKEGDPSPLAGAPFSLKQARTVYDMIYRPAETPLLREAREAGCRTANGLGMLLYQGAKALEIWTEKTAPVEVMREALSKNIYQS